MFKNNLRHAVWQHCAVPICFRKVVEWPWIIVTARPDKRSTGNPFPGPYVYARGMTDGSDGGSRRVLSNKLYEWWFFFLIRNAENRRTVGTTHHNRRFVYHPLRMVRRIDIVCRDRPLRLQRALNPRGNDRWRLYSTPETSPRLALLSLSSVQLTQAAEIRRYNNKRYTSVDAANEIFVRPSSFSIAVLFVFDAITLYE